MGGCGTAWDGRGLLVSHQNEPECAVGRSGGVGGRRTMRMTGGSGLEVVSAYEAPMARGRLWQWKPGRPQRHGKTKGQFLVGGFRECQSWEGSAILRGSGTGHDPIQKYRFNKAIKNGHPRHGPCIFTTVSSFGLGATRTRIGLGGPGDQRVLAHTFVMLPVRTGTL